MAIGEFQPIDLIGLQGGYGNLPTFANAQAMSAQRGQQAATIDALRARAMNEQSQAQQAQQQQQQAQAYHQALQSHLAAPSPQSAANLTLQFPEYAQQIKQAYDMEDSAKREGDLTLKSEVYSRAHSGDYKAAAARLKQYIDADKAAGGDTSDEEAMLADLESGDPSRQNRATGIFGYDLATIVGPEKWAAFHGGKVVGGALVDNTGKALYATPEKEPEPKYMSVGGNIVEVGSDAPATGSRAARNNNPGNLEASDWTKGQPGYSGTDGRFAIFDTPANGAAAQTALLGNYMDKGVNTIGAIVSKWAPASDRNNVNAYVSAVSKATGIKPGAVLTPDDLPAVQAAMAQVEGGGPKAGGARVVYSAPSSDASVIARGQVIETPNGPMIVDKATGVARPVTMNGKPVNAQTQQKREVGAKRVLALIDSAEKIIPQSTGSGLGAGVDWLGRGVGFATEGSKAISKLQAISGALIADMPRMEGPQSDRDVQLYKQAAGDLANPTIPNSSRLEALATLREIQTRYAGLKPKVGNTPADIASILSKYGGK